MNEQDTQAARFDVRVVRRNLREGSVSHDDYQAWLDALPDDSDSATETETRFVASNAEGAAEQGESGSA